jgi:hypothetical protein
MAVVSVGALAGCGGDSEDDAGGDAAASSSGTAAPAPTQPEAPPTTLSVEQWTADVEAICAGYAAEAAAIQEPTNLAELAAAYQQVQALAEEQYAELLAIEPPASTATEVVRLLDLLDQQIESVTALAGAAARGDQAGIDAAHAGVEPLEAELGVVATALGVPSCGP